MQYRHPIEPQAAQHERHAALAATVAHLQGMEMVREISSVMRVEGESE